MRITITCENDHNFIEALRPSIDAIITPNDNECDIFFEDAQASRLQGKINTFFRLAKVNTQMRELVKEVSK